MTPDQFDYIANILKDRSGLSLSADKTYLLESRLTPIARKHGLEDLGGLIKEVQFKKSEPLIREITEAMTTNESFFFRDGRPFDMFREYVLPQLLEAQSSRKQIRIWSAACSSGQEPYSLAMILKEQAAQLQGWRVEIVATDISSDILEKAKVGIYSQFEVQRGLPIQMLMKYFEQNNELWQIDSSIRAMVKFQEVNLLGNLNSLGTFDVVYCRNVLIYFDQPTKSIVLDAISKRMQKNSYLFMGAAETVLGISDTFKPVSGQRGLYSIGE